MKAKECMLSGLAISSGWYRLSYTSSHNERTTTGPECSSDHILYYLIMTKSIKLPYFRNGYGCFDLSWNCEHWVTVIMVRHWAMFPSLCQAKFGSTEPGTVGVGFDSLHPSMILDWDAKWRKFAHRTTIFTGYTSASRNSPNDALWEMLSKWNSGIAQCGRTLGNRDNLGSIPAHNGLLGSADIS